LNFISKNSGFTLIEVTVATTISLFVVLMVSITLNFFVNGWQKSREIFQINQKFFFIDSLINLEFNNFVPINYNGKLFIKGGIDYFAFITDETNSNPTGRNEVGYFFKSSKKVLLLCFKTIANEQDIVDYAILENEGSCVEIDDIDKAEFRYIVREPNNNQNSEKVDIDGELPISVALNIKFIVNDKLVEKEIKVSNYE